MNASQAHNGIKGAQSPKQPHHLAFPWNFEVKVDRLGRNASSKDMRSIHKLAQLAINSYDYKKKSNERQLRAIWTLERAASSTRDISGGLLLEYAKAFKRIVDGTGHEVSQMQTQERAAEALRSLAGIKLNTDRELFIHEYGNICVDIATAPHSDDIVPSPPLLQLPFELLHLHPNFSNPRPSIHQRTAMHATAALFELIGTPVRYFFSLVPYDDAIKPNGLHNLGKLTLGEDVDFEKTNLRKEVAVHGLARICQTAHIDGVYDFATALLENIGLRDANIGLGLLADTLVEILESKESLPTATSRAKLLLHNLHIHWQEKLGPDNPQFKEFVQKTGKYFKTDAELFPAPPAQPQS